MSAFLFDNPIVSQDLAGLVREIDWSFLQGKTVFVTGANGHIASYLTYALCKARQLGKLNCRIIVNSRNRQKLDELYGPFIDSVDFLIIEGDISSLPQIDDHIDYIFHFAGNASPYFIKNDPIGILKANIDGTFNVAELAARSNGCKVVYASTREVYGDYREGDSLNEESFGFLDPLSPRSCYPESKRAAEAVLEAYHLQKGIQYGIARIAHCYGPGMKLGNDGRIMSDLLNDAVSGHDLVLNSDGSALRSFCYITDAIKGLLLIAKQSSSDVFNLSNESEEISILGLAKYISGLTPGTKVVTKEKPTDKSVYCNYKRKPLDCTKLMELGWTPSIGIKEGVSRTLESFRK